MYKNYKKTNQITAVIKCLIKIATICFFVICCCFNYKTALAMPFYHLHPSEIVLRSSFYTTYSSSSEERKHNIKLASNSLNNTIVDAGGEFSFNLTVGARTERKGYKNAKIIVNGEFIDGVGGGVCQVSTTLYNAVLLSGLKIIEYHPHSLPVSYVSPSFDAMVNSGSADLRFINNTSNPIIIKTYADGSTLKIDIYGQELKVKYQRKSVVISEIPCPDYQILIDEKGEYPDLKQGEQKIVKYGTKGIKSQGFLVAMKGDKIISVKKIRSDTYAPTQGKIIVGTTIPMEENSPILNNPLPIDL